MSCHLTANKDVAEPAAWRNCYTSPPGASTLQCHPGSGPHVRAPRAGRASNATNLWKHIVQRLPALETPLILIRDRNVVHSCKVHASSPTSPPSGTSRGVLVSPCSWDSRARVYCAPSPWNAVRHTPTVSSSKNCMSCSWLVSGKTPGQTPRDAVKGSLATSLVEHTPYCMTTDALQYSAFKHHTSCVNYPSSSAHKLVGLSSRHSRWHVQVRHAQARKPSFSPFFFARRMTP